MCCNIEGTSSHNCTVPSSLRSWEPHLKVNTKACASAISTSLWQFWGTQPHYHLTQSRIVCLSRYSSKMRANHSGNLGDSLYFAGFPSHTPSPPPSQLVNPVNSFLVSGHYSHAQWISRDFLFAFGTANKCRNFAQNNWRSPQSESLTIFIIRQHCQSLMVHV